MNKRNCKKIASLILNEDENFSQAIEEHCLSCVECQALRDSWKSLRDVKLDSPPIALALEKSILEQAIISRKRVKHLFLIKHIFQYSALAAAICIGFIVIFNRMEPTQNLPSRSTQNHQWSWEPVDNALLELQKEVERSSSNSNSSMGLTHADLNIDTVIDGINYYEVIL